MNITAVEIAKLSLAPGDALAVMVPEAINADQREIMVAMASAAVGADTRIIILDGGVTLATISRADLVAEE